MIVSKTSHPFLIVVFFLLVVLLAVQCVVPPATEDNCFEVNGVVEYIGSPCCEDVVFNLRHDGKDYYINRGLEQGLDVNALRDRLLENEVNLKAI